MNESLKTTLIITGFLFFFILFLLYLLYCFAYYDKNQEEIYYTNIVDKKYDYIYTNIVDKDGLSKDDFNKSIKLMDNQKNLKDIYYLYYRNSDIITLEDFISKYYYGDAKIEKENIEYSSNGKTTLFKRRAIFYKSINLINKNGNKSSIGVKRNISFKVEGKSSIKIDDKELKCVNGECTLAKVFGGIHEIRYVSNGFEYYGLINIIKDKQVIEVTNIDELVRVDLINDNDILVDVNEPDFEYELKTGKYSLNKCYLSFSCPSTKSSYLLLNEDGSCELYTYITLDQAGDLYKGTYVREGNFLIMKFNGHTYQVFDYDTKVSTDINAKVDMEIRYKINGDNSLLNDSYRFKFSE